MPLFDLHGRVALVTGGGQGVGAAVAATLIGQGAAVAVNDLDADRAERVSAELSLSGTAVPAVADVTDRGAVAAMVERVAAQLGPVDILVNNAGIPGAGIDMRSFADTDPADWRPLIELNLFGVLNCAYAVLPSMTGRGWGRIVTIASDAARIGEPRLAIYAAAKAAAAAWSRSVAKEVGRDGITCNCLSLGTIERPDGPRDAEALARQLRRYPVGRLGRPADVAAAVAWLASTEGEWVTGQTIPVNGGYSTS